MTTVDDRHELVVRPEYRGLTRALSLAAGLVYEGRCDTWNELMGPDGQYRNLALSQVKLSAEDGELLDRHAAALTWVHRRSSTIVCPVCQQVTLTTGTVPTSCKFITEGCKGKPIKVARATKLTAAAKKRAKAAEMGEPVARVLGEVEARQKTSRKPRKVAAPEGVGKPIKRRLAPIEDGGY